MVGWKAGFGVVGLLVAVMAYFAVAGKYGWTRKEEGDDRGHTWTSWYSSPVKYRITQTHAPSHVHKFRLYVIAGGKPEMVTQVKSLSEAKDVAEKRG